MAKKKSTKKTEELTPEQELESVLDLAEKKYGRGSLAPLAGKYAFAAKDVDYISTGSMGLDDALGVGGVPRGRVVEIYGPESSGKTTLALHVIANAQKLGHLTAFIDAEHALDPIYASALGVDLERLLLSQPSSGEQALNLAEDLVRTGKLAVVVIDSVAALVPQAELNGETGDSLPGLQARLMSQALRKMTGAIKTSNTLVIFINQTRDKIGVMFGSPKTTSGGNALKFYASVRLDIRRIGSVKRGEVITANRTKVKVVKNKLAPPFRTCEFDLKFGEGIDWPSELLDLSVDAGLIKKAGSWYSYGDDRLGQGRLSVAQTLRENAAMSDELKTKLKALK